MTTLTPEQLDALERGLAGVTRGPWHPGHFGRPDHPCDCRSIVAEGYAGSIAEINVKNDLPISEGGNDAPPPLEAAANMRHIARCDPQTIAELVRLARIGIAYEQAAERTRSLVAWLESDEARNLGVSPKLREAYLKYIAFSADGGGNG